MHISHNAVHVPLGIRAPIATVRLTEGKLKADVATILSGTPSISIPGVSSWKAAIPALQQLGTKSVLIAFDADSADNPTVARALAACVDGLSAEGFAVAVERWPTECKGIDDALSAGAAVEVLSGDAARAYVAEMLATATVGEPPPPPTSISGGRATVQFVDVDTKRKSIRLGDVTKRTAEAIRVRVEALLNAKITNTPVDRDTANWLAGIGADLADKLASAGLMEARDNSTLGDFTASYIPTANRHQAAHAHQPGTMPDAPE